MLLTENEIKNYGQVVAKAVKWLCENKEQRLATPDSSGHYKAPYLYAVTGERDGAREHVDLIVERYQQSDGDFRTRADYVGWAHDPAGPANRYVYADSWLIVGLQKLEIFGPAQKALGFIKRFQDDELGGFRSRFDPAADKIETRYLDSCSTGIAGLALLSCGEIGDAVRAGDFILRIVDSKGNLDGKFFTSWDTEQGLMTDVFKDDDPLHLHKQFCVDAGAEAGKEQTWMIGLAMTFLAKLFDATGDERFLAGADKLFEFFHTMDETRWTNPASCKVMWGGSVLYRLTGNKKYGETAKRMLDFFSNAQYDWGGWVHTMVFKDAEEQPFLVTADIACELCGEISETIFNLSGK